MKSIGHWRQGELIGGRVEDLDERRGEKLSVAEKERKQEEKELRLGDHKGN